MKIPTIQILPLNITNFTVIVIFFGINQSQFYLKNYLLLLAGFSWKA